jgi:hypothetical protein
MWFYIIILGNADILWKKTFKLTIVFTSSRLDINIVIGYGSFFKSLFLTF